METQAWLDNRSWVETYWAPYSDHTFYEDIAAEDYSTSEYPYMCVGAYASSDATTASLAACGLREDVLQATYSTSTAYHYNGAYWYRYAGKSFGFAPSAVVYLNSADTSSDTSGAHRLSWHLDQGHGGFRAGNTNYLNSDNTWYKRIVIVSVEGAFPTMQPTLSVPPTLSPTTSAPTLSPTTSAPTFAPTPEPSTPVSFLNN